MPPLSWASSVLLPSGLTAPDGFTLFSQSVNDPTNGATTPPNKGRFTFPTGTTAALLLAAIRNSSSVALNSLTYDGSPLTAHAALTYPATGTAVQTVSAYPVPSATPGVHDVIATLNASGHADVVCLCLKDTHPTALIRAVGDLYLANASGNVPAGALEVAAQLGELVLCAFANSNRTITYTPAAPAVVRKTQDANTGTLIKLAVWSIDAAAAGAVDFAPATSSGSGTVQVQTGLVLAITPRPDATLDLSATAVAVSATEGNTALNGATVNVTSGGASAGDEITSLVATRLGSQASAISATLDQTTTPAVLSIVGGPGLPALAPGVYTVPVSISGTGATNSPRTLTVTLTVHARATLADRSTVLTVTATSRRGRAVGATVTWTTSDPSVATVEKLNATQARVTAQGVGTAIVRASTRAGQIIDECEFTVRAP